MTTVLALIAISACTTTTSCDLSSPAFTNSLGMTFAAVPIGDGGVLFACEETQQGQLCLFRGLPLPSAMDAARPATHVSWHEAVAFCDWLTQRERGKGRINAGQQYRLPTDHEWSYAVGIGHLESINDSPEAKSNQIESTYPWGTSWPPPPKAGNLCGRESRRDFPEIHIANYQDELSGGLLESRASNANQFGIHDLSGSVWEWCQDLFRPGTDWRVLRGGSWKSARPETLLSSHRTHDPETYRSDSVGFRCVLATK
jgi:formylglycine-generating enzyme required for sulfatase activity